MQRLPGLTGRVRDEHPTIGLLLLGAPDVEGGVLLGGLGRAVLPGSALRWWRQRHLLVCLFCRLLRRCPPRPPAAVEEFTWAPARPPFPACCRTPPPCRPCGGRRRVKRQGPKEVGRQELHSAPARPGLQAQVQPPREPQAPAAPPSAPAAGQRHLLDIPGTASPVRVSAMPL